MVDIVAMLCYDSIMETTTPTSKGRRDEHRPVNLVTEDYDYVECYDSQSSPPLPPFSQDEAILASWRLMVEEHHQYMQRLRDMVATSSVHRGLSQCHHCGAHIRYGALLHHRPTDTFIAVGEVCLENRFSRATLEFQRLRREAQLDRERYRIRTAVAKFVEENPDIAFMADPDWTGQPDYVVNNGFLQDVARKIRRYGDPTERQLAAVRHSIERDRQREVERAAEVWVPIPQELLGRNARVTGTVLSTRWQENAYGGSLKMLLKVDANLGGGSFKVWSTVPKAAGTVERGDTLSLIGELDVSDDDPSFGFMRRPRLNKEGS